MIRYWLWNRGEILIVLSAYMAAVSMPMNWVPSEPPLPTGYALVFLAAWAYPLFCVFSGTRIVTDWGNIYANLSMTIAAVFLYKTSQTETPFLTNPAAFEGILLLLASMFFSAGITIYSKIFPVKSDSETTGMGVIGRFLWVILGGAGMLMSLVWWTVGLVMFVSIIGIPWGKACFVIGKFTFLRFGKEAFRRKELQLQDAISIPDAFADGNVIWFIIAGLWLALGHVILALACITTIVGIPFGIQHIKLAGIALSPVGKTIMVDV